jgi:hypothetical protein
MRFRVLNPRPAARDVRKRSWESNGGDNRLNLCHQECSPTDGRSAGAIFPVIEKH